jgi:Na+-transporting NADH:ubiquinone oxidoreductase subunit NqrB
LLHDCQHDAVDLCDDDDDDGLARYYVSFWFEIVLYLIYYETHGVYIILFQRMRPHRQVEVVLLMKLVHPLILAKDINNIKCIIMLCYFSS